MSDAESPNTGPITVLIADDHDILRDGLKALLSMAGDIQVVGEAHTGREAMRKSELLVPDVILMDISMPELDGVEACRRIRAQLPESHVLFLTMHEAEEYFFRALQAGASGYVIKRTAAADLVAAVRAVARGESFLSPSMARTLIDDYAERDLNRSSSSVPVSDPAGTTATADKYATLTSREREILQLVGEGNTNQDIAENLHVSIKTVQAHRAAVMMKLGLRDVTHLVRYAVRRGIVDPEY